MVSHVIAKKITIQLLYISHHINSTMLLDYFKQQLCYKKLSTLIQRFHIHGYVTSAIVREGTGYPSKWLYKGVNFSG